MATKGKNKSILRRKARVTTKSVNRDLGARGNSRMIMSGYKSGVRPRDYPKRDTEGDRIDGYDRDDLGESPDY